MFSDAIQCPWSWLWTSRSCVARFQSLGAHLIKKNTHFVHQVAALLDALSTVYSQKNKKAKAVDRAKHKEFLKQKEIKEAEKQKKQKLQRKKVYRAMGQNEQKRLKSSLKRSSKHTWGYLNTYLILLNMASGLFAICHRLNSHTSCSFEAGWGVQLLTLLGTWKLGFGENWYNFPIKKKRETAWLTDSKRIKIVNTDVLPVTWHFDLFYCACFQ